MWLLDVVFESNEKNGEISFAFIEVGSAEWRKQGLIPFAPHWKNPNLFIALRKQRRRKLS